MKVDGVVVGCVIMSVWVYMYFLCMLMSIVVMHALSWLWLCMYGRSDMHFEVIVCN